MNQNPFSIKAFLLVKYHSDCQISAPYSTFQTQLTVLLMLWLRRIPALVSYWGCTSGRQAVHIHPIMHDSSAEQLVVKSD